MAPSPSAGQEDIIHALTRSGALQQPVTRIDTHAAVVLLSGPRALKIKRDVRYPFLDYSTLERRKAACEAELAVNRPFAPDIYLGVTPITRGRDGTIMPGGDGEIVEWAIEMRRFDETQTLDKISDRSGLSDALAHDLAATVAEAHKTAAPADTKVWLDSLRSFIAANKNELGERDDLFLRDRVATVTDRSLALYERLCPLLRRRGEAGFVRHCHGDLHLSNVVLLSGRPVLFDAIEFDPAVASGDVLYDLAFLLMDLLHRREKIAANIVLNDYLMLAGDDSHLDALAALPLFMSVRAAIRAKVTAARARFSSAGQKASDEQIALSYFELADRLLSEPRGVLVAIGGLSGTGKSALARVLAPEGLPEPGAVVLRSDVERKALFGVAPTQRLPATAYTRDISAAVYKKLADKAARVIDAGFTAIVDAVFGSEAERDEIEQVAAARDVPFIGLFLTTDIETRLSRVGTRRGDASDADEMVVRQQAESDIGRLSWTEVDASGSLQEVARAAKRVYVIARNPAF
jgi:aminoglycoside phosphotransferase family enzyme/predicted kinase